MVYNVFNVNSKDKYLNYENKGTKEKYWILLNDKSVLIKLNKYKFDKDVRSYNVSEKIFSEIANYLNFSCVDTDFIIDENLKFGIASHDYREVYKDMLVISGDDLFLSAFGRKADKKNNDKITKEDYCYSNVIKILLYFDAKGSLIEKFNSIMVMDALTGESDRHFENWGIYCVDDEKYDLLPMYDNSSCLLHQFRDEEIMDRTTNNQRLEDYVYKSKCKISIDGKLCNHFEFIDYLLRILPNDFKKALISDIEKLKSLDDIKIQEIVNSVPNDFCSRQHKDFIIKYIKIRRDILLDMVNL